GSLARDGFFVTIAVALGDAGLLGHDGGGGGIRRAHALVGGAAALLAALGEILRIGIIGGARVVAREQQDFQRRRRRVVVPRCRERDAQNHDAMEQRRQEQRGGQPILDRGLAFLEVAGKHGG